MAKAGNSHEEIIVSAGARCPRHGIGVLWAHRLLAINVPRVTSATTNSGYLKRAQDNGLVDQQSRA